MEEFWGYGNRIIRNRLVNSPRFFSEVNSLWLRAQQKIHGYQRGKTEQGVLHCMRVEDNIGMLLRECAGKFKDEDLFVLSAASALHDIGKIEDHEQQELNHGRLGAQILRRQEIAGQFFADQRFAEAVGYVVSSHDDGDLQDVPEDEFLVGTCPLFLRELASIFRLADMIDTDYRRVSDIAMGIKVRRFIENEALWLARNAIKGWKTYGDEIIFQAIPRSSRESISVETYVKLLNESLSDDQIQYLRSFRVVYFNVKENSLEEDVIRFPHRLIIDPKDHAKFPKSLQTGAVHARLSLEVYPLETKTRVMEDAIIMLRVYNSGLGEATNMEIQGWENIPQLQLVSSRRIVDVPAYSRVEHPLRIRATKKGRFILDRLILVHGEGDVIGEPEIQIPPFVISATVKKPELKLSVIKPKTVDNQDIFNITLRIENIGDGDAQDIYLEVPMDQKLVISGFPIKFLPKLREKAFEEFNITLKAPDEGQIRLGSFQVSYRDAEGNEIKLEKFAEDIPITRVIRKEEQFPALVVGQSIIESQFSVDRKIGAGAFADVWLLKDRTSGRLVAMKLVRTRTVGDASQIRQLAQETKKAAEMHHPNLVAVYSFGFWEDYPYITMEFVDGETLQHFLHTKEIDLFTICNLMADASRALDYLHGKGVVHGDVKPSNIIRERWTHLWKLADFLPSPRLIASFRGTPSYSAPEVVKGLPITEKSDIYSLGAVLREILTGHPQGDLSRIKGYLLATQGEEKMITILTEVAAKMTNEKVSDRPTAMEVFEEVSATWVPYVPGTEEILCLAEQYGGVLTKTAIARKLSILPDEAKLRLEQLHERGIIDRFGAGEFIFYCSAKYRSHLDEIDRMIIESSLKNQGRASSSDLVQMIGLDLLSLSNRLKKLEMNRVLVYDKSSDEYILKVASDC